MHMIIEIQKLFQKLIWNDKEENMLKNSKVVNMPKKKNEAVP